MKAYWPSATVSICVWARSVSTLSSILRSWWFFQTIKSTTTPIVFPFRAHSIAALLYRRPFSMFSVRKINRLWLNIPIFPYHWILKTKYWSIAIVWYLKIWMNIRLTNNLPHLPIVSSHPCWAKNVSCSCSDTALLMWNVKSNLKTALSAQSYRNT